MTRIGVALAVIVLGCAWNLTALHAQEPSATPEPTGTAAATGTAVATTPEASPTSDASPAASPTPFNTPEPGELIAPAPQPTSAPLIAPQTGFGDADGGGTPLWTGLAALGVILGTLGVAARRVAVRERNR
jgi:hypothetical protein